MSHVRRRTFTLLIFYPNKHTASFFTFTRHSVYPVREHMTFVMPDWETVPPVWEHLIVLHGLDKTKYSCNSH